MKYRASNITISEGVEQGARWVSWDFYADDEYIEESGCWVREFDSVVEINKKVRQRLAAAKANYEINVLESVEI